MPQEQESKNLLNTLPKPPLPPVKSKKPDFHLYQEKGEGVSNKELDALMWYERHRLPLFKLLFIFLILLNAAFWIYSGIRWGDYLFYGIDEDRRLESEVSQSVDYSFVEKNYSAKPLQILTTELLPGGVNKYDAVAVVSNPNPRFLVSFNYYFVLGDFASTTKQNAFLLPGESRPISYLGIKDAGNVSPQFWLGDFKWLRINAHRVPNIEEWQNYRLNFTVSDFKYTRASPGGAPEPAGEEAKPHADAITFKVRNNSPYGYERPKFVAGLYQNQALAGVTNIELEDFVSQETKEVDIRSFAPNLGVDEVRLFPVINIYDKKAYLAP